MDHRWRAWWAWLPWKFLSLDAGGAFAWAGNYVLLGWLFRTQLETLTAGMARFSALFGALIGLALAAYVTAKVIQRRRIYRTLMVATITPGELKRRMDARENLVILDLRTLDERREGRIPGSLQFDQDKLSSILPEMPQAEVILFSPVNASHQAVITKVACLITFGELRKRTSSSVACGRSWST